jgi:hypothetical protein
MESGAGPKLSRREAQNLEEFITEFQDIFATKSDDYGRPDSIYHSIDFDDATLPVRLLHLRRPLTKQTEVEKVLKGIEKQRVIGESASPLSLPIVLLRKKGDLCFCVDCIGRF